MFLVPTRKAAVVLQRGAVLALASSAGMHAIKDGPQLQYAFADQSKRDVRFNAPRPVIAWPLFGTIGRTAKRRAWRLPQIPGATLCAQVIQIELSLRLISDAIGARATSA